MKMNDPLEEMRNKLAELMLPTEEFNEEFNLHVGLAKKSVEEGKIKEYAPRVILVCAGDEPGRRKVVVAALDGMPETNQEKQAVFGKLGLAAAANDLQVLMAIFQSEAWTLKLHKDEVGDGKNLPRPSEHPDRIEVIVNIARSVDDRHAMATIPITGRNEDESLVLGEPDIHEFETGDEDKTVQDTLLSAFFAAFLTAIMTTWAAKRAKEEGEELPSEVKLMLELLESCPIKFKPGEDRKLDDFLKRFKR